MREMATSKNIPMPRYDMCVEWVRRVHDIVSAPKELVLCQGGVHGTELFFELSRFLDREAEGVCKFSGLRNFVKFIYPKIR